MNFMQSHNASVPGVLKLTTPNKTNSKKIMHLAEMFNEVSGSERPLIPDFYDCGTTARAIFMHLINLHRGKNLTKTHSLYPNEMRAIYEDYRPSQKSNVENLREAIHILENMQDGVMILTVRYWYANPSFTDDIYGDDYGPNRVLQKLPEKQFGHVWVIEKKDNFYYIYQSSLNEYMTYDYFCERGAVLQEGGPRFLKSLEPLVQAKNWSPRYERLFMDKFWFMPKIQKGTSLRPEFFFAYVEY